MIIWHLRDKWHGITLEDTGEARGWHVNQQHLHVKSVLLIKTTIKVILCFINLYRRPLTCHTRIPRVPELNSAHQNGICVTSYYADIWASVPTLASIDKTNVRNVEWCSKRHLNALFVVEFCHTVMAQTHTNSYLMHHYTLAWACSETHLLVLLIKIVLRRLN